MFKFRPESQKMSLWGIGPIFVIISLSCFALGSYLSFKYPSYFLLNCCLLWSLIVGAILALFGLGLWLCGAIKIIAPIKSNRLETAGCYSIVRNPIYAGFYFLLCGASFALQSWLLLLVVMPLNYLVLKLLLIKEERILTQVFGADYLAYKTQVNAVFPSFKQIKNLFSKKS